MYLDYFKDKKITVMGLGLLGRGIGDVRFLAECGADLIVTDIKTAEQLGPALEELRDFKNITYVLGEHRLEDFRNRDLILKTASVPLDSIYIAEAEKSHVLVTMSATLLVKLAPEGIAFIGVTGTKGKTTTTYLIYEILKMAGHAVHLGGNIRGVATLPLLAQVKSGDYIVLELDSWQLQGFAYEKLSPHVAVFTNLLPDHMNYYGNSMERYFADKANIFKFQKAEDVLIVSEQAADLVQKESPHGELVIAETKDVPSDWQLAVKGEHSKINIALAIHSARALGVGEDMIRKSVESFTGVEGRLQYVKSINDVEIYNDNNATVPESTISALKSFGGKKNIVLIVGGTDKGLDMQSLVVEIGKQCKAVVLLRESGTERIKPDIMALSNVLIKEADGISECVSTALELCNAGDILLFSPAFASFGKYFKNEYDRGDQFLSAIKNLDAKRPKN